MGGKLLILLAFICTFVHGAEIAFNLDWAEACAEGCSFFNSSIWVNETVPGANDTAIISGLAESSFWIYIPVTMNASVGSISLLNTGLVVQSTLTVNSIMVNASYFLVFPTGKVLLADSLLAVAGSNVTVLGGVSQSGFQSANATFVDSLLWVTGTPGYFWLLGYCTHSGQLVFERAYAYTCNNIALLSPFTATGSYLSGDQLLINGTGITFGGFVGNYISVKANSTATITGELLWGAQMYLAQGSVLTLTNFANGTANITSFLYRDSPPVGGTGTLQILDSEVHITGMGSGQLFSGILALGGVTQLIAQNFATTEIDFLPYGLTINDTTYLTITGNNLLLGSQTGTGRFDGELVAFGQGISLIGDFDLDGPISASNSQLTINGSLIVQNSFNTVSFGTNVSITLSGQIIGAVALDNTSSLVIAGRSTWFGNLLNNGVVRASSENPLIFNGNYNQTASGTFYAQVDSDVNAPLRVNGVSNSITLAGTLKFTTQEDVFSATTFLVAWSSNGTINGTFAGKPQADSQSTLKTTSIEYTPYQVTLVYHISPKDFPKWVWGAIGGGALLILIIIIALAVKCRRSRRPKYSPIP